MRAFVVAVALLAAACVDGKPQAGDDLAGGPGAEGYTLELRASEGEQIFLVTSPDGRTAAARASQGVSALLDGEALRALPAAESDPQMQEVVSLRMPGIDLSVSGAPDSKGEDGAGRVAINVGGRSVEVDATEGGPGGADDNAHVLIRGVPESEAREFIAKADALSPAVQAQMLAELGLD